MTWNTINSALKSVSVFAVAGLLLAGCENPSNQEASQQGYRGTAMESVKNAEIEAIKVALNNVPEALYPPESSTEGDMATDIYENVQVLTNLRAAEFDRLMAHMTEWIAPPEEGCAYCHSLDNGFADDSVYTKHVARTMLQMTININANWESHVGNVGVTCYTCHRGNAVPENLWFKAEPEKRLGVGYRAQQNRASKEVNFASLPEDPFSPYLLDDKNIRVNSPTALPSGKAPEGGIKNTEYTYSLMTHMSQSLGVNCTFCHNTRAFAEWDQSPEARATAWFGIRMVRDINNDYMVPLTDTFPENRLGPTGDVGKVYCATCHVGVNKPMYGAEMLKDHPELWGGRNFDTAGMTEEQKKAMVEQAMAEAAMAHSKATKDAESEAGLEDQ